MRSASFIRFIFGAVIAAIVLLLIVVFSGKAYAQTAGVSTMSAGDTTCFGGGGGGECEECEDEE